MSPSFLPVLAPSFPSTEPFDAPTSDLSRGDVGSQLTGSLPPIHSSSTASFSPLIRDESSLDLAPMLDEVAADSNLDTFLHDRTDNDQYESTDTVRRDRTDKVLNDTTGTAMYDRTDTAKDDTTKPDRIDPDKRTDNTLLDLFQVLESYPSFDSNSTSTAPNAATRHQPQNTNSRLQSPLFELQPSAASLTTNHGFVPLSQPAIGATRDSLSKQAFVSDVRDQSPSAGVPPAFQKRTSSRLYEVRVEPHPLEYIYDMVRVENT